MDDGRIRFASPAGRWVLLATVLGSGIALLDGTVVNVALPALGADLDAGMAGLQWTVNAYTLTLAGLILLGGALGDRYGRRRVFLVGVVWFALASALCGLAPNLETLVAARALQAPAGRCSPRAPWRSSRRPSRPETGPARSAPGPGWAGWRRRSGRCSAGGWWTRPAGAGCS